MNSKLCFFCGQPSARFTCYECGKDAGVAATRLLEWLNKSAEQRLDNGECRVGVAHSLAIEAKLTELRERKWAAPPVSQEEPKHDAR